MARVSRIRARIQETRTLGYAVNPGLIVTGSWGMGAAVFDPSGQPAWALSLTGIAPRFAPERRPDLGRLLLHHAHELSKNLYYLLVRYLIPSPDVNYRILYVGK